MLRCKNILLLLVPVLLEVERWLIGIGRDHDSLTVGVHSNKDLVLNVVFAELKCRVEVAEESSAQSY